MVDERTGVGVGAHGPRARSPADVVLRSPIITAMLGCERAVGCGLIETLGPNVQAAELPDHLASRRRRRKAAIGLQAIGRGGEFERRHLGVARGSRRPAGGTASGWCPAAPPAWVAPRARAPRGFGSSPRSCAATAAAPIDPHGRAVEPRLVGAAGCSATCTDFHADLVGERSPRRCAALRLWPRPGGTRRGGVASNHRRDPSPPRAACRRSRRRGWRCLAKAAKRAGTGNPRRSRCISRRIRPM
jgi:hypothetical protein